MTDPLRPQRLPEPPPAPAFTQAVMARVRASRAHRRQRFPRSLAMIAGLVLAGIALLPLDPNLSELPSLDFDLILDAALTCTAAAVIFFIPLRSRA